jgi:hypothetical protein
MEGGGALSGSPSFWFFNLVAKLFRNQTCPVFWAAMRQWIRETGKHCFSTESLRGDKERRHDRSWTNNKFILRTCQGRICVCLVLSTWHDPTLKYFAVFMMNITFLREFCEGNPCCPIPFRYANRRWSAEKLERFFHIWQAPSQSEFIGQDLHKASLFRRCTTPFRFVSTESFPGDSRRFF